MVAEDLYGLPLERFVSERTALAKQLRASGDRDEAARVARLAKPSLAAWAVNQLIRTQPRAARELFAAGDALQRAQEDVMAGQASAVALREAAERERAAVTALTEASRGLLSSQGHGLTATTLGRVSETLHAAALEEHARARVTAGCLDRELQHAGLGAVTAGRPATARQRTRGRGDKAAGADHAPKVDNAGRDDARGDNARGDDGAQADDAAAREQAERAARLKATRRAEVTARRAEERAAREVDGAQERRDRAAEALEDAERALATARERAARAAEDHRGARQRVEGFS